MSGGGWFNYGPNDTVALRRASLLRSIGGRLRTGGFASVELNLVGWVALVGPGVVLGLLFARLTERSFLLWGLVGGFVVWVVAVALDNLRAGQQPGRLQTDALSPEHFSRLNEAARHAGIKFTHENLDTEDGPATVFHAKSRYINRLSNLLWQTREE